MNSTLGNRHGSAVITLPSDTEILITRQFDAPAALVFKALTTPELVKRWWGFDTSEWLACEVDFRVGGQWRFVTREGDMEVGFHGEYLEIAAPHRLGASRRNSRSSVRNNPLYAPHRTKFQLAPCHSPEARKQIHRLT